MSISFLVLFLFCFWFFFWFCKLFHFNQNIEYSIREYIFIIRASFFLSSSVIHKFSFHFISFLFFSFHPFFSLFMCEVPSRIFSKNNLVKKIVFFYFFYFIWIIVENVGKCGAFLFCKMNVLLLVLISKSNNKKQIYTYESFGTDKITIKFSCFSFATVYFTKEVSNFFNSILRAFLCVCVRMALKFTWKTMFGAEHFCYLNHPSSFYFLWNGCSIQWKWYVP